MTDIFELLASHDAIEKARAGDLLLIIERLEAGKLVSEERTWLAQYLRGEHKAKRGRPKRRQQLKRDGDIKEQFDDNNDIDLAAWDAVKYLVRWEGMAESEAKKEVASILEETRKNIEYRLGRIKSHFSSSKSRAAYMTSKGRDQAALMETMDQLLITTAALQIFAEAFGTQPDPPILLVLGRK